MLNETNYSSSNFVSDIENLRNTLLEHLRLEQKHQTEILRSVATMKTNLKNCAWSVIFANLFYILKQVSIVYSSYYTVVSSRPIHFSALQRDAYNLCKLGLEGLIITGYVTNERERAFICQCVEFACHTLEVLSCKKLERNLATEQGLKNLETFIKGPHFLKDYKVVPHRTTYKLI